MLFRSRWVEVTQERGEELLRERRKHTEYRLLQTCPGIGPIRAAQLLAVVVTLCCFQNKRKFWKYCGLGFVVERPNQRVVGIEVKVGCIVTDDDAAHLIWLEDKLGGDDAGGLDRDYGLSRVSAQNGALPLPRLPCSDVEAGSPAPGRKTRSTPRASDPVGVRPGFSEPARPIPDVLSQAEICLAKIERDLIAPGLFTSPRTCAVS